MTDGFALLNARLRHPDGTLSKERLFLALVMFALLAALMAWGVWFWLNYDRIMADWYLQHAISAIENQLTY